MVFLSGKYNPREIPQAGRLSSTGEETEEHWSRRNTEQNWQILTKMVEVGEEHNATPSQVALAWLRKKPAVTSVIMGVSSVKQLEDNLGAAQLDLSEEKHAGSRCCPAKPVDFLSL